MVLSNVKKIQNCNFFLQICKYKNCLALIFLNFFTHYLFIGYFKFVSDDWPQMVYSDLTIYSLKHLFFESQRPGQYILIKFFVDAFGSFALGYHLVNLITTTILLILVYLVLKEILKILLLNPTPYAFIGAVLFCIIFNKDELYSWANLFYDNIAFVLYFGSFYLFLISAKKWYYSYLSWIFYALAVFIYEVGVLLPIVYIFYNLIQKKDCKNIIFFFIPPIAYMLIKITNWFGYGWVYVNHSQHYFSLDFLSMWVNNCIHNVIASIGITVINLFYAILGLAELNIFYLFILLILDFVISFAIVNYFSSTLHDMGVSKKYNEKNIQAILFSAIGLFLSYLTISAHGIVQPRYLFFIDFFAILLIIIIIYPLIQKQKFGYLLALIIAAFLLINQGLYINWIISGDIQESVNDAIFSHAEDISEKKYFFVNSSDFSRIKPNYVFILGPNYSLLLNQNTNQVYYPYLNAEGLAEWSVSSMMRGAHINSSSTTLIYGTEGNIFVEGNKTHLKYLNTYSGTLYTISQSECFEGNSSNLLADFNGKMKSNLLFKN